MDSLLAYLKSFSCQPRFILRSLWACEDWIYSLHRKRPR